MFNPNLYRFDFFLIWPHGLKYVKDILSILDQEKNIEILRKQYFEPKTINSLVDAIYSYDYAPIEHLQFKTKYLLSLEQKKVMFVFIKNNNPDEVYLGEKAFRHTECMNIKRIKENIRNLYNPRLSDGKRSEDHIIHASDNQIQTDHILKYLKIKQGISLFTEKSSNIINSPYHLGAIQKYTLKQIDINALYANIHIDDNIKKLELRTLDQTPHYLSLPDKPEIYNEYLSQFEGKRLRDNHSFDRLKRLYTHMTYLKESNGMNYILCRKINNEKYIIVDGVHRAAVLKKRNIEKIIVAIINE